MFEESWIMGLAGGLLIGSGAAMLLLMNGRIAGVSGILGGLIDEPSGSRTMERLAFMAGLAGVPFLYAILAGTPAINVTGSLPVLLTGGLLVGLGARTASGCTSGHGVCGLSRFSPRSIVSMAVAVSVGVAVVALSRNLLAWG
ncbi:MAG: YeeE/YedE thiosulfate transporter family protein [Geminicoccaceae bacterium]